ncbi:MAG TPA: polyphenol oxidase family protein [Thermoanaerobaculia bacterium]|nr:polyphenol oxidase family protein [Thermoanaerobaculia bacterium]
MRHSLGGELTTTGQASPGANGCWIFRGEGQGAAVGFAGRGPVGTRQEVLFSLTGERRPVAWARQIHSARVLPARSGECGEGDALVAARSGECGDGDALVAREPGIALSIVTADCVPVLLAGPAGIAAAHAGWRGIAAGVVGATVAALGGPPDESMAWIGPAIGRCCYETGPDVAAQVAAASDPAVVIPGPAGRPHLDLQDAVRRQLVTAGLHQRQIRVLPLCTKCEASRLHSYRREGKGAGRNHAFIWLVSGLPD